MQFFRVRDLSIYSSDDQVDSILPLPKWCSSSSHVVIFYFFFFFNRMHSQKWNCWSQHLQTSEFVLINTTNLCFQDVVAFFFFHHHHMWIFISSQLYQHSLLHLTHPFFFQFLWFASNDALLFVSYCHLDSLLCQFLTHILWTIFYWITCLFLINKWCFDYLGLLTQFLSNIFPVYYLWL